MKKYCQFIVLLVLIMACDTSGKQEGKNLTSSNSSMDTAWWKEGVLYQIYPQSFKDSNGDGFGDFQGIISKLDYLESLGITMVWMNPFFKSPLIDNGYDVSDYRAIDPRYGTIEDFEEMLDGMKKRGIRFVLDVVVNHSSDQHDWFQSASRSRESEYYNYYHWWPAEKGEPPYRHSLFDPEGAWDYVEAVDAYFLHTFAEAQPDLNWENPELRQEVYDIMKFWAEKGVDGFRMDAFQFASKDTTFPEWPEGHEKDFIEWYGMRPQLHDYLNEMYKEVIEPYQVFAVAEGAGNTFEDAHKLVDAERNELQVAYHFETVDLSKTTDRYELSDLKEVFTTWDSAFSEKGWIAIFLSNHDNARLVTRYGNDSPRFRRRSTQMLNTFLLSMRGTPYTYYGDELGMTNIDMPAIEDYVDVAALGDYQSAKKAGKDIKAFMKQLNFYSRENARTPMQWSDDENAGFTSGAPWKRVNPNYKEINVAKQEKDPNSVLNHFRRMTKLRNENKILVYGQYELLQRQHSTVYAYTRTLGEDSWLVLLNFSQQASVFDDALLDQISEIKINNYEKAEINDKSIVLSPYQAIIFALEKD